MNKVNCLIYLRVSDPSQIQNFSLDSQLEICAKVAKDRGYIVDRVFREEGVSAKTANRPELINLLEYARKNKSKTGAVMVYKFDRLARNTADHLAVKAKLAEYGITLLSATEQTDDSPTGKFVEVMFSAIAELDNSVRAERIREGVQKRFFAGLTSKLPLGYKMEVIDGKKTPVPDEFFPILQNIWQLMATGTKSLSEITKIMNDKGLKIRCGSRLRPIIKQSASKIFNNRFYCGYLTSRIHPDWIAKGVHTPMVTEETFNRVRAIILGKTQLSSSIKRRVNNPEFPLRGQVRCYVCNKPLVASNCRGRTRTYPKYWCTNGCIPTISSDDLNLLLNEALEKITYSDRLIDLFNFRLRVLFDKRKNTLSSQRKVAEQKSLEAKQMMSLLIENHLKGLYSDEIFTEQKAKIEDTLLTTQIAVSDATIEKYDIDAITNFVSALLHDLPKAYEVSDYSQRRLLIGSIYPSGLLFDGKTLLNHKLNKISPSFRLIQEFCEDRVPLGGRRFTPIEPFLSSFQELILAYPDYQAQFNFA